MVNSKVLSVLKECANHHTRNIKVVNQENIKRLEDFSKNTLQPKSEFPLFLYTYKPSWIPFMRGKWEYKALGPIFGITPINGDFKPRCDDLLKWLNTYYHSRKTLQFFYVAYEPYVHGRWYSPDINKKFTNILKNCPLLISCNHPALPWSYECTLMPDAYILSPEKQKQITDILSSTNLLPFNKRKSIFYFRGALTGPRLPFSQENVKYNPRHGLLEKINKWPFLDYKVSTLEHLDYIITHEYREYVLKNFSHLKCDPVNFFEHAKHKYLLSFDGFGSAWSRVPLILATGSVLVLNAICQQYFYCLMVENHTHVTIKSDLSDGEEIFRRLENNPKLAEKIGTQGRNFANMLLTKEAVDTYLWLVLKNIEDAYQET